MIPRSSRSVPWPPYSILMGVFLALAGCEAVFFPPEESRSRSSRPAEAGAPKTGTSQAETSGAAPRAEQAMMTGPAAQDEAETGARQPEGKTGGRTTEIDTGRFFEQVRAVETWLAGRPVRLVRCCAVERRIRVTWESVTVLEASAGSSLAAFQADMFGEFTIVVLDQECGAMRQFRLPSLPARDDAGTPLDWEAAPPPAQPAGVPEATGSPGSGTRLVVVSSARPETTWEANFLERNRRRLLGWVESLRRSCEEVVLVDLPALDIEGFARALSRLEGYGSLLSVSSLHWIHFGPGAWCHDVYVPALRRGSRDGMDTLDPARWSESLHRIAGSAPVTVALMIPDGLLALPAFSGPGLLFAPDGSLERTGELGTLAALASPASAEDRRIASLAGWARDLGRSLLAGNGIPAGCPATDPVLPPGLSHAGADEAGPFEGLARIAEATRDPSLDPPADTRPIVASSESAVRVLEIGIASSLADGKDLERAHGAGYDRICPARWGRGSAADGNSAAWETPGTRLCMIPVHVKAREIRLTLDDGSIHAPVRDLVLSAWIRLDPEAAVRAFREAMAVAPACVRARPARRVAGGRLPVWCLPCQDGERAVPISPFSLSPVRRAPRPRDGAGRADLALWREGLVTLLADPGIESWFGELPDTFGEESEDLLWRFRDEVEPLVRDLATSLERAAGARLPVGSAIRAVLDDHASALPGLFEIVSQLDRVPAGSVSGGLAEGLWLRDGFVKIALESRARARLARIRSEEESDPAAREIAAQDAARLRPWLARLGLAALVDALLERMGAAGEAEQEDVPGRSGRGADGGAISTSHRSRAPSRPDLRGGSVEARRNGGNAFRSESGRESHPHAQGEQGRGSGGDSRMTASAEGGAPSPARAGGSPGSRPPADPAAGDASSTAGSFDAGLTTAADWFFTGGSWELRDRTWRYSGPDQYFAIHTRSSSGDGIYEASFSTLTRNGAAYTAGIVFGVGDTRTGAYGFPRDGYAAFLQQGYGVQLLKMSGGGIEGRQNAQQSLGSYHMVGTFTTESVDASAPVALEPLARYRLKLQVLAGRISLKVWKESQPEPASYQLVILDSSPLPGGFVGFMGGVQAGETLLFHSLAYSPPGVPRALGGLVSWWSAEGNARDLVGANHGQALSGTAFAGGKAGQAFQFDGMDDRVAVPDSNSLDLSRELTISLWTRPEAQTQQFPNLASKAPARGGEAAGRTPYAILIGFARDRFTFRTSTGGNYRDLVSKTTVDSRSGVWTHLAGTYDGRAMKIYVDGVLEGTLAVSGDLDVSDGEFTIGNYSRGEFSNDYRGAIDEVALHSHALSDGEIADLARGYRPAGSLSTPPAPPPAPEPPPGPDRVRIDGAKIAAIAASPSGDLVYAGTFEGTGGVRIHIVDTTSMKVAGTASLPAIESLKVGQRMVLALSPKADRLLVLYKASYTGAGAFGVFEIRRDANGPTLLPRGQIRLPSSLLISGTDRPLAVHPDPARRTAYTGNYSGNEAKSSIDVLDYAAEPRLVARVEIPANYPRLEILPDGSKLYVLHAKTPDGDLAVFLPGENRLSGTRIRLPLHDSPKLVASPDSRRLYVQDYDTSLNKPTGVWYWQTIDAVTDQVIGTLEPEGTAETFTRAYGVTISQDSKSLYALNQTRVLHADLETGQYRALPLPGDWNPFATQGSRYGTVAYSRVLGRGTKRLWLLVTSATIERTGLGLDTRIYFADASGGPRAPELLPAKTLAFEFAPQAVAESGDNRTLFVAGPDTIVRIGLDLPPEVGGVPVAALWKFDEGSGIVARDSLGTSHGELRGGASFAPGVEGTALALDGRTGQVFVSRPVGAAFGTPITIETWIYPESPASPTGRFLPDDYNIVGTGGIGPLLIQDSRATFQYYVGDASLEVPAVLDRWTHLAATHDGKVARFYVDGNEVRSFASAWAGLAGGIYVGTRDGRQEFFKGRIDELAIYSGVLTPETILARHEKGIRTTR